MSAQDGSEDLRAIDRETLRWLVDFTSWKRRKAARPEDVGLPFLRRYIDEHLYDYYFLHRNYTHLMPLLDHYERRYSAPQDVERLLADARAHLETLSAN